MTMNRTELTRKNEAARKLLDSLTDAQLDEIGVMLGMSNMGCERFTQPEEVAETDEMYDGFMEEIRSWQKQLRDKREKWGWCDDLQEMADDAKLRKPGEKVVMPKAPKITARQEGGDDDYCYVVRIDGKEFINGLTRSEVPYWKRRALKHWEKEQLRKQKTDTLKTNIDAIRTKQ